MTAPRKMIVVDPILRKITVHHVDEEGFWHFLDAHIGPDRGWETLFPPGEKFAGVQFILHDWAITQPNQRFFRIAGYPHPLGGKVVFMGYDREGETVSVPEPFLHWLTQRVTWCPSTMKFVRFEDSVELVDNPLVPGTKVERHVRKSIYEGEGGGEDGS